MLWAAEISCRIENRKPYVPCVFTVQEDPLGGTERSFCGSPEPQGVYPTLNQKAQMVFVGVKIHAANLTLCRPNLDDEEGKGSPSDQMGGISSFRPLQIHPIGEPLGACNTCPQRPLCHRPQEPWSDKGPCVTAIQALSASLSVKHS